MNKYELFDAWAPAASRWSPWVKPALFAHLPLTSLSPSPLAPADASLSPAVEARCALVIDLPGPTSVALGLALALRGYRPVPLFNSCPPREAENFPAIGCAVDAGKILTALVAATPMLLSATLVPDAPPAFLLDSHRSAPGSQIDEKIFDNRSVTFASDFPSVKFLLEHGIESARFIHDEALPVGEDLRHALRHWPGENFPVTAFTSTGSPLDVSWPRGGFFGELEQRLFALFRLRRNALGGFGGIVPESTGG